MLRTKVSSKTSQLSGYAMPRLLAIASDHVAADVLLGTRAAEALLTSDTKIEVPIGKPIDTVGVATDEKNRTVPFFSYESERSMLSVSSLFKPKRAQELNEHAEGS